MLALPQARILAQQNSKLYTDISSWTYNSKATLPTDTTAHIVTVLTASPPAVGSLVSLKPNGGGFTEQICEVLTVSAGVNFTVEVKGLTTLVTGGTFTSTGEQLLFKWTMPKGTMQKNDTLIVRAKIWCGISASLQKIHFKVGGSDFAMTGFTDNTIVAAKYEKEFSNKNDFALQIGDISDSGPLAASALGLYPSARLTLTKDTLNYDQDITITCEKPSATGGFGVDSVHVLLLPSVQSLSYI